MSIRAVTMYQLVCDWPSCETSATDMSEVWAWTSPELATVDAFDIDWRASRDETQHYCPKHPSEWASDHEDGEPYPDHAHLVIHDGDTGDHRDDGRVTYVPLKIHNDTAEPAVGGESDANQAV